MQYNKQQRAQEKSGIALSDRVCLGHRNLISAATPELAATCVRELALKEEVTL